MNVIYMLSGAIILSCFLITLFFLRSWRTTRDRFFLFFALSFFLQGCSRLAMSLMEHAPMNEDYPAIFITRIFAFSLILVAIADKNRRPRAR